MERLLMGCSTALLLALAFGCSEPQGEPIGPDPDPAPQPPPGGQPGVAITLAPAQRFQTIVGWEAHNQSGQHDVPNFTQYSDTLFDLLVHDLGVSRIRLEVRSGMENTVDIWAEYKAGRLAETAFRCKRWEVVNDDGSPQHIDWSGFHFSFIDQTIEKVILPIRQKLNERGEQLYLNLTYVSFAQNQCENAGVHRSPAEYAEFILAAFQHMDRKYGLVPNAVEIILEPDIAGGWSGRRIGEAIVATGTLLQTNGYRPDFIGPSTAGMQRAPNYLSGMLGVAGVKNYLKEVSYHRYEGENTTNLQAIVSSAMQHGLRTAMLERLQADYEVLHEDLKAGRVSAWQQFAIAFTGDGKGGNVLFGVDFDRSPPRPFYPERTKFLRQYFKYVRPGAVRIGAASAGPAKFDPLAFINRDGRYVVVIKAESGGTVSVQGLPEGRYGIMYTTASEFDVHPPDVVIGSGQALSANIPARGVITIHAK